MALNLLELVVGFALVIFGFLSFIFNERMAKVDLLAFFKSELRKKSKFSKFSRWYVKVLIYIEGVIFFIGGLYLIYRAVT